ncbi:HD domain-containing protein|uniref:HD-GYP domain, c-di-GMP phosphodiesterase class II (Or its inactivated variant) n=1 Tax=Dendrosporobacter quercicolus TaxID=146817 RepID=A0A1G9YH06_9FIRM|nr:HD domain-containing phosphohydrolase [Dendrosporobacter quercicolus]NSL47656.1 HD domain-containing protein [Dendrosporobacter quercicolus DSM 1736]SDN08458.1 HD-GYP domain, c-di-GMP phosphodiesterase class II (or its inactivated variant) [Dendrosporobacter quercicolus]
MEKVAVSLDEVIPGMITAESIMPNEKQIILQKNTELTTNMIDLLKKWKIESIYVKYQQAAVSQAHIKKPLPVKSHQLRLTYPSLQKKYNQVAQISGNIFEHMRNMEYLPYDLFRQLIYPALYDLLDEPELLTRLYQLKPFMNDIHCHAVNVGLIAGLIGRWCGFKEPVVQSLILSGVMHDIGKTQIPPSILKKSTVHTLEEKEILKLHPFYGYYLIKSVPDAFPGIECAILQHHEREDGSGYPQGIKSAAIHPFAKIIAIADVYDTLTMSNDKKNLNLFSALEIIINKMFLKFDPDYCKIFVRNALHSLNRATVLLSDNTQADVLYFPCFMSAKPLLKRTTGASLDLNQTTSISIIDIISTSSCTAPS